MIIHPFLHALSVFTFTELYCYPVLPGLGGQRRRQNRFQPSEQADWVGWAGFWETGTRGWGRGDWRPEGRVLEGSRVKD